MDETEQSLKQKKITLAQSEHARTVIEIMRDCASKIPLVGDTEWKTIVNTITLDAQSTLIREVADYMEEIRKGLLHEPQK